MLSWTTSQSTNIPSSSGSSWLMGCRTGSLHISPDLKMQGCLTERVGYLGGSLLVLESRIISNRVHLRWGESMRRRWVATVVVAVALLCLSAFMVFAPVISVTQSVPCPPPPPNPPPYYHCLPTTTFYESVSFYYWQVGALSSSCGGYRLVDGRGSGGFNVC